MEHSSNYKKYMTKNPIKKRMVRNWLYDVEAIVNSVNPRTLLDVGCGEGFVVEFIKRKKSIKKIIALDISQRMLELAERRNSKNCEFVHADARDMPFKEDSFDLVIMLEVLEHITKPENALKEIRRVTKGLALIGIPYEPYYSILHLLSKFKYRNPEHINFWNKKQMTKLLRKYFKIKSVTKSACWLLFLVTK